LLLGVALSLFAGAGADAQPAPNAPAAALPARTAVGVNGLVADLYTPSGANGRVPAIIVLGGSEGGFGKVAAWEAWLLAEHGFAALQLACFDGPGQSHRLAFIPLEYFQSAIDWRHAQPMVDPMRIGLLGASRGGEAALLIAAHDPAVRAVVAAMPSSVVWPGIARGLDTPAFTLAGKPVPFLPAGTQGGFTSVDDLFAKGLLALDQHPDAVIPVETINGPVLLVCGEQDRLWPSCDMSRQVAARLKAKAFKFDVQLLAYDDAGHYGFGPPLPRDSASFINAGGIGRPGRQRRGERAGRAGFLATRDRLPGRRVAGAGPVRDAPVRQAISLTSNPGRSG
jgi:dienelactone hydrolase